jgi:hypothetical protein
MIDRSVRKSVKVVMLVMALGRCQRTTAVELFSQPSQPLLWGHVAVRDTQWLKERGQCLVMARRVLSDIETGKVKTDRTDNSPNPGKTAVCDQCASVTA